MSKTLRVLIIKLASMGDLVHLLPALTDACEAYPSITFDWVVDKSFSEVPSWHGSVHRRILTNHRKWRSSPFAKKTRTEFSGMLKNLREEDYDLVIDAQGNLKTGILGCFAKGKKVGASGSSVQEWGTHFFYQKKINLPKNVHAITFLRTLLSRTLNYPVPETSPNYGIDKTKLMVPNIPLPSSYLIFVPIASFPSKLWPEKSWRTLIDLGKDLNLQILIPSGNETEKQRAEALAKDRFFVTALPKLTLSEIGYLILNAKAVVSVDTGLSHIAAALDTPSLTLYGPTNPDITGTIGKNAHLITAPCNCPGNKTCKTPARFCLKNIAPEEVFEALCRLLP